MNYGDIGILVSLFVCLGIIVLMIIKMRSPKACIENHAEVIKKNHFWDRNYRENGIRVEKELFSITFLINGKKKTYYCRDGIYNNVTVGDKVKIRYNRSKIIDLDIVK